MSAAVGPGGTPSSEVALQELLDKLMQRLDGYQDDRLKTIAVLRLEGATTEEIAEHLGCTQRTVQKEALDPGAVVDRADALGVPINDLRALPLSVVQQIDRLADRFERDVLEGKQPNEEACVASLREGAKPRGTL